jgi:hypothetical protein
MLQITVLAYVFKCFFLSKGRIIELLPMRMHDSDVL